jgi:glycosyltransferase involved in cell wall biosynthesis
VRLVFLDAIGWDYDADTPLERPLGGVQSAAVYLAAELAALGVEVAFINDVKSARVSRGVRFVGRDHIRRDFLDSFDAVIALSGAMGAWLRGTIGATKPLILWTGHPHDQPAVQNLRHAQERDTWSALAMVSDWQAGEYQRHFGIPRERMAVMRNAAAPAFLEAEPARPWFESGSAPVLAYTSIPYRGLDLLLTAFPAMRKHIPDLRLRVFSSMAVYQASAPADEFGVLYELCRALPGAEYVGALPQPELARAMAGTAALAYPCTVPETSCIAIMEAMAVGALIVSTQVGALAETSAGFAMLLPLGDRYDFLNGYTRMVVDGLRAARDHPAEAAGRRNRQIEFARANYSWKGRAQEWVRWLSR